MRTRTHPKQMSALKAKRESFDSFFVGFDRALDLLLADFSNVLEYTLVNLLGVTFQYLWRTNLFPWHWQQCHLYLLSRNC